MSDFIQILLTIVKVLGLTLIVILLSAVVLTAAGIIFLPIKIALERVGFTLWLKRAWNWALDLRGASSSFTQFFERANAAAKVNDDPSVRIVLDRRHKRLRIMVQRMQLAVRTAVDDVRGLGGEAGPAAVLDNVRALQLETRRVAEMGGEIEDGLEERKAEKAKARTNLVIVAIVSLFLVGFNGALLNLFFQDLFPRPFLGLRISALIAAAFIVVEFGCGYSAAWFKHRAAWVGVGLLLCIAGFFEFMIFGILSNTFQLDIPALQDHPMLRWWMAPVGLLFVGVTAMMGFILHRTIDKLAELKGTRDLKREIAAVNKFIAALPACWDEIGKQARKAEIAIDGYVQAIGGQAGALRGTVDRIVVEREALVQAAADMRVDDWPDHVGSAPGDARDNALKNFGLLVVTLVAVPLYGAALFFVLAAAFGRDLGPPALAAVSAVATLAFGALGLLSFERLEFSETGRPHVHPMRPGPLELGVAIGVATTALLALVWIAVRGLGLVGAPVGLVLFAGGAGVALLAYHVSRVARGAALAGTVLVALGVALIDGLGVTLGKLLVLVLATVAWVLFGVICLLACLLEAIWNAWKARQLERAEAKAVAEAQARALQPPAAVPVAANSQAVSA